MQSDFNSNVFSLVISLNGGTRSLWCAHSGSGFLVELPSSLHGPLMYLGRPARAMDEMEALLIA